MYQLEITTRFKKDLKKVKRDEKDFELVRVVLKILQQKGVDGIPTQMRPHMLSGRYKNNWECHIKPDLLIIWIQIDDDNVVRLVRIGSHSELFR